MTTSAPPAARTARPGARDVLAAVLDPGSFRSWDAPVDLSGADPAYRRRLLDAEARCGADESILTGAGTVAGRRVAVAVSEFAFLAGSVGSAAAARLVNAVRRATAERLPLLVAPASGGTRMQEGTAAFLAMVPVTAAVADHRAAGLPFLVHLRHPTTGGVLASWASLGHVTTAEPGALVGFLGPRVQEALSGAALPAQVQTAENLLRHGLVDAVVPLHRLRSVAGRALAVLGDPPAPVPPRVPGPAVEPDPAAAPDPWRVVQRSREPGRPGLREVLAAADDVLPLRGTGQGESGGALLLALVRLRGTSCVLVGQDRYAQAHGTALGPAGLRTARRGMRLAEELGLPLVTVVDTPGAELSAAAEEQGLAGEIARCLADLVRLRTRTVSVLLGAGAGGGALALLPADRVLAASHSWLAPLPPEGASAVVHRDTAHAPELARSQGIDASALRRAGFVDVLVPEPRDAAEDPEGFVQRLCDALGAELAAGRGQRHPTPRRLGRHGTTPPDLEEIPWRTT
ncbi:carboxyl transferase domain-containing protein [Kineococcus esterisolvens]|uniref:carboxyl transferase domain-containing protein n=1 Tax=unclassified Kineococcus TaxID=2621656 RepID=UPI003D7CDF40